MNKKTKYLSIGLVTILIVATSIFIRGYKAQAVLGEIEHFGLIASQDLDIEGGNVNANVIAENTQIYESTLIGNEEYMSIITNVLRVLSSDIEGGVLSTNVFNDTPDGYIDDSSNIQQQIDYATNAAADVVTELLNLEVTKGDIKSLGDISVTYTNQDKSILLYELKSTEYTDDIIPLATSTLSTTVFSETTAEASSEVSSEVESEADSEVVSETDSEVESEADTETEDVRTISELTDSNIENLNENENLIIQTDANIVNLSNISSNLASNVTVFAPNADTINITGDVEVSVIAPEASVLITTPESSEEEETTTTTLYGNVFAQNITILNANVESQANTIFAYDWNRGIDLVTITINLVKEDGTVIQTSEYTREAGYMFSTVLNIPGKYQVIDVDKANLVTDGFILSEDTTIDIEVLQLYDSEIKMNYIDSNGDQLQASNYLYGNIDEEYNIEAPAIEGYTLTQTDGLLSGFFTDQDLEITFTYTESDKEVTITISHVDSDGNTLAADTAQIVAIGQDYDANEYVINNPRYEFTGVSSTSAPIKGTATKNLHISLVYTQISTCSNINSETSSNVGNNVITSSFRQTVSNEIEANTVTSYLTKNKANVTDSTFGKGFSYEGLNFIDYKYSFDTASNYTQIVPVENLSLQPTYILITDGGNSYDIRAETSTSNLFNSYDNIVKLQQKLKAAKVGSILIAFNECDVTIHSESTSTASTTTSYDYSAFSKLDETSMGYVFTYNATSKTIAIDTMARNANGKLIYQGQNISINTTTLGVSPKDYALIYNNDNNNVTSYLPKAIGARHMVEVNALNSPYIDTNLSSTVSASEIASNNAIYGIYSLNGVVKSATQLTNTSIKTSSLPYNPNSYSTLPTNKKGNYELPKDAAIYGYVAGYEYKVNTNLTLNAETPVVYAKNKHPKYSISTSSGSYSYTIGTDEMTTLNGASLNPVLNVNLNGVYTATDPLYETKSIYMLDETGVDFSTSGNYQVIGVIETVDNTTGDLIKTKLPINLSINGATMDYGDAPTSYGSAGALIGNNKYRYTIGINRNGNRQTHADAESLDTWKKYAERDDARGDDETGITDETGWFNMDTNGIGKLNLALSKATISFPYTASGNATIIFWIDYDQDGVFEDWEASDVQSVRTSAYNEFGMVDFKMDLHPEGSTIKAGDKVMARVRIVSGKNSITKSNAATNYTSNQGETEDFQIQFYQGGENVYQICNQALSNTPIITVANAPHTATNLGPNNNESGIVYTADIGEWDPQAGIKNKVYKNVKIEISSKQGIKTVYSNSNGNGSNGASVGLPIYFTTVTQSEETNVIHISVKDKNGNPLNLPLTFSIWGLNEYTGENINESISIGVDDIFVDGLTESDIKTTADSVGIVEDFVTYIKLSNVKDAANEPSSMFLIQNGSLAKSDISIVENARDFEIGIGLDLGQVDKLITECISPYNPLAQIEILGDFYGWKTVTEEYDGDDDGVNDSTREVIEAVPVNIYTDFPFKYQSTNIPVPYFQDLNSVTQILNIPEGIEFVDTDGDGAITDIDTDVTIYRRDFLGSRTESDWKVVDESLYTQTLDWNTNTSTVVFNNPIENNIYGYEYRMEYNLQVSDEMQTGQQVIVTSEVEFNKGTSGSNTETYYMNDIILNILESFQLDLDTVMGSEDIVVQTDSTNISYTYEYQNCDTCDKQTDKVLFNGDITIPIATDEELGFTDSTDAFDRYEDILFKIYDGGTDDNGDGIIDEDSEPMKVFEVHVYRWKPTELELELDSSDDLNAQLSAINDKLNPTSQNIQIRASYTKYEGFEKPVTYNYSKEQMLAEVSDYEQITNNLLQLDNINISLLTEPDSVLPSSWQNGDIAIDVDNLVNIYDKSLAYDPADIDQYVQLLINSKYLDSTLETSNVDGLSSIFWDLNYEPTDDGLALVLTLSDRYVIEHFNGRIYNADINSECLEYVCSEDVSSLHLANTNLAEIISGYRDSLDDAEPIINTVNGLPLDAELDGERVNYSLSYNLGLNQTNLTLNLKSVASGSDIQYYSDEGGFYFKRTNPTDEEVECIKAGNCSGEYNYLTSGSIDNTGTIKNKIENDTSLLSGLKSANEWLKEYIS